MSMPCRPTTCDHLQCFDASLFLMMNEKKPTWTCPVCDSPAKYDDLMVDGYFQEVIKAEELPDEENEIILNQDGSWNPVPKDEEAERLRRRRRQRRGRMRFWLTSLTRRVVRTREGQSPRKRSLRISGFPMWRWGHHHQQLLATLQISSASILNEEKFVDMTVP